MSLTFRTVFTDINCFYIFLMIPFTITFDIIFFLLYLIIYPVVCIFSPVWFTLLYPFFSEVFHHISNNYRKIPTKFILTDDYYGHDCSLTFYIEFFIDLFLNLEVLLLDTILIIYVLILFLLNIVLFPVVLLVFVPYFILNAINYVVSPILFMSRFDVEMFEDFGYKYDNEYYVNEIKTTNIFKIIPNSLLVILLLTCSTTAVLLAVVFIPVIILFIVLHFLLSIPFFICGKSMFDKIIKAPFIIVASQIASEYSTNDIYDIIDEIDVPYKPTISEYMSGDYLN